MTTSSKANAPLCPRGNKTLKNKEDDNPDDEKEHVKNDVELTFDVLTIIFKNLSARDLHRAATVCRLWNDAAENEKRIRGATSVALFNDLNDLWTNRQQTVNQSWIKPMLSLMFSSPFDDGHPATQKKNSDCSCKVLPSGCSHIVVGNSGVIKDETELEENPDKAAWILLPYDKDVIIETICIPMKITICHSQPGHYMRVKKSFKNLLATKNKFKCLILLTNEVIASPHLMLQLVPRDKERAVAGTAVGNLAACKRDASGKVCSESMACIGIAISGPNVHSWSIVLKKSCDTKDKVVEKLKLLKDQVQLRKHSVGFMFACQGRGEYMFHEKNVESTAFKELFPQVPLVGSFGGGEYGDSTVDPVNGRVHQYSTVFMIVTYG